MNIKDLKRSLDLQIEQRIREFEQASGCLVTGVKVKHDEDGLEVKAIIEL